jgi:hypothetical protein
MSSNLRNKIVSMLAIVPLVGGLAVAAYKFGPAPVQTLNQREVATPIPEKSKPDQSPTEGGQLFALFGMSETATGKGRVQATPSEYLNSLEALYLQRGYRKVQEFDPAKAVKPKQRKRTKEQVSAKFFQRDETGGIGNISATGTDADFRSEENAVQPYTFTTIVTPVQEGGSDWATYKIAMDYRKPAGLANIIDGDFPGTDPTSVPRLSGLQRIFALTSGTGTIAIYRSKQFSHTALMTKYLEEMPRHGWLLDSAASAEASKLASGVMCFTQGTRSCLIWVTPGRNNEFSNVTISSY